jgi:molybdate transport system regulatory protein
VPRRPSASDIRLTIRVDVKGAEAFGPGKARLLERVNDTGSIRAAAADLGMSYRQGWLLLRAVEETFGPVLKTATGGRKGGGAALTPLGHKVLELYRAIETRAADATTREVSELLKVRR